MASSISREYYSHQSPLTFTTNAGTTASFGMSAFSGGVLYVSALGAGTSATLTFFVRPQVGPDHEPSAWYAATTSAGQAVTLVVAAGKAYALPDDLFGATEVRATGDTSVTCFLTLKG